VTTQDENSVYTSKNNSESESDESFSEFHIDLNKGVVTNCELNQGTLTCVRSDITDRGVGLPEELNSFYPK
jgi:hypothetical protein